MQKIRIKSFGELHSILEQCRADPFWMFRGQSDASWKLIPRAGRAPFNQIDDEMLFSEWKEEAIQYVVEKPKTKLEWLALAQHNGLATRLLDWSRNPLVAAFFAVWEERNTDAALFAFRTSEWTGSGRSDSPFAEDKKERNFFVWMPDAISSRISRQQGVFTVHQPAKAALNNSLDHEELLCILIDKKYREKLQQELSHYGITRASLFPDLDGLASHHNWRAQYQLREYWQKEY